MSRQNLAQKRRQAIKEDLRRRALNNGSASPTQQSESADLIRILEKRVKELEAIVYSEELA